MITLLVFCFVVVGLAVGIDLVRTRWKRDGDTQPIKKPFTPLADLLARKGEPPFDSVPKKQVRRKEKP